MLIGIMALLGVGGSGGEGRNQNDFAIKQNNLFSQAKGAHCAAACLSFITQIKRPGENTRFVAGG